jgi:hypothetical protein
MYSWFSAQQPVSDSSGHLDGAGRRLLTLPPIPDAQRPYPDGTAAGQPLVVGGTVNPADTHNISGEASIFLRKGLVARSHSLLVFLIIYCTFIQIHSFTFIHNIR